MDSFFKRKKEKRGKGFDDGDNAHSCDMNLIGIRRPWLWQPRESFFFARKSLDFWASGGFSNKLPAPIPHITEEKEYEVLDFSPP